MKTPRYNTVLGLIRAKGLEQSPEFEALEEAVREGLGRLSAVALEVILSHYKERFQNVERRFFHRIAATMRREETVELGRRLLAS